MDKASGKHSKIAPYHSVNEGALQKATYFMPPAVPSQISRCKQALRFSGEPVCGVYSSQRRTPKNVFMPKSSPISFSNIRQSPLHHPVSRCRLYCHSPKSPSPQSYESKNPIFLFGSLTSQLLIIGTNSLSSSCSAPLECSRSLCLPVGG